MYYIFLLIIHIYYKKINTFALRKVLIIYLEFYKYSYFNQQINDLPNSITHLTLGDYFNQLINNLPNSITYLKLGSYFNKPINNLPLLLKEIQINRNNKNINKIRVKYPECKIVEYQQ